ncbi:glycosyltransferase [uncultured Megasphaera sp.]|uniref:glycosyltransferase n=1 Tax=uncultured Megasphaera sp. TaxID=165188 RepID=UPI0012B7B304
MEILEKYAKIDFRIYVLRQKNLYAGVARNTGMAVVKGKYYIFLDADDFFDKNLLFLLR